MPPRRTSAGRPGRSRPSPRPRPGWPSTAASSRGEQCLRSWRPRPSWPSRCCVPRARRSSSGSRRPTRAARRSRRRPRTRRRWRGRRAGDSSATRRRRASCVRLTVPRLVLHSSPSPDAPAPADDGDSAVDDRTSNNGERICPVFRTLNDQLNLPGLGRQVAAPARSGAIRRFSGCSSGLVKGRRHPYACLLGSYEGCLLHGPIV